MNCHTNEPFWYLLGDFWILEVSQSHLQLPLLQKYATEALQRVQLLADRGRGARSVRWRLIAAHFKCSYRNVFHSVKIYLEFYMKLEELWILLYVLF